MPAYVVAEIEITDAEGYKAYTQVVPATIAQYGGRFLVRGGRVHVKEGDWPERRRVILEFPTLEAAQAWYDSSEYEKPKAMRIAASKGRLAIIEGA